MRTHCRRWAPRFVSMAWIDKLTITAAVIVFVLMVAPGVLFGDIRRSYPMTIFHEREQVAEALFVHEEEALFDDRLRGVKALATWTSTTCGWDDVLADAYRQKLLNLLVKGSSDEALLDRAVFDCPGSDRQYLARMAREVFFEAVVVTSDTLT